MKKKADQGFSLVEVIIALSILAIVSIPLLSSFAQSAKTNAKAREIMNATNLAQNIVEEIKADGALVYTGLTDIGAGTYVNIPTSDTLIMGGKQYYARVSIEPSTKMINSESVFPFQGIDPSVDAVYQCSNEMKKEIAQAYIEANGGDFMEYTSLFNEKFYLSNLVVSLTENGETYLVNGSATYHSVENGWSYTLTKLMYNSADSTNLNLDDGSGDTGELRLKNMYVFYCNAGNCEMEFRNETTANVDQRFYIINQMDGTSSNNLRLIVDNNLSNGFFTEGGSALVYHNFLPSMVFVTSHCEMRTMDDLAKIDKRLYDVKVDIYKDSTYINKITTITGTTLK